MRRKTNKEPLKISLTRGKYASQPTPEPVIDAVNIELGRVFLFI